MKKIFLSLSLLLFVSCVNLNKLNVFDKKDSKVAEKNTANSNKNVASSKKDKQKKSAPIVPTKGTKSKNLLRDAEAMPEDNYANRVKKYKAYNSLVAFNPSYKPNVEAKMEDLKSKIESTYTVKVSVTDLILQNLTKKEDFNSVGSKVFNYSNANPDLNLLVEISSVNYSKPTVNVKTAPKEYSEEYVNSEGNKVLNVVKYYENETTKTTALSFVVTYKLVSNLTGENQTPLEDREVVSINKINFDQVMKSLDIHTEFSVKNRLNSGSEDLNIDLNFESIQDFNPDNIINQVPELKKLLQLRKALVALKGPMGNMPDFRKAVLEAIKDEDSRKQLLLELKDEKDKE